MEGRSPVDKVWVSLRQRHGNIDGADRLPAFRTPVGTHDEIEQIIHTSLLATAEAQGCSCQFSPDKSTARLLGHAQPLKLWVSIGPGLMTFTRMAGLQCSLYQLD